MTLFILPPKLLLFAGSAIKRQEINISLQRARKLTLFQFRNGGVVLELIEGSLQHVFRVDLLHTQQVEHHVVGEVEGAVQGVGLTLISPTK